MKKFYFLFFALALFSLSACNKLKDIWEDHRDDNDPQSYKITKWERNVGSEGVYTGNLATITYDSRNNPVRVNFDKNSTGYSGTDWKFEYDNKNRLSKCYMYYSEQVDDYGWYFIYLYDNKGRIVSDTTYLDGGGDRPPGPPSPANSNYFFHYYTYDAQGRIIKVRQTEADGSYEFIETFSYDSKGNLKIPGATYDNKISFYSTNKVWQFINRNYSKNNALPAVSYNGARLPRQFDTTQLVANVYLGTFLNRPYNRSAFTYKKID